MRAPRAVEAHHAIAAIVALAWAARCSDAPSRLRSVIDPQATGLIVSHPVPATDTIGP